MPTPKIDRVKLRDMLRKGKPQHEIAQYFDVTEGAISKAKGEINVAVVKNVALENAHRIVEKELNAVEQLQKINERANDLLDDAMGVIKSKQEVQGKDPREIALKAMAEIRGQINLQLEIFKTLYDMKAAQEFQTEVLEAIGEVEPDVRNRILNRLNKAHALRAVIKPS